ncbi:MAG: methylmalonyl Co-A mutase-associated GTPase MeaB [Opitutus sp.]|nr:methylmalonyl Co-A mutase-associated GTPase MeaB [Opitutus sp.]
MTPFPPSRAGPKRHTAVAVPALAAGILRSDRTALARGITLIESRRSADRARADELLQRLALHAGGAVRVGISGPPGAGKSTFIDALGLQLCSAGKRVAVLSVDPSSPVTHGSILGDKARMERLSREPNAFIRPSPSGGELGGVARRTRETIALCEAAGYDVVLVETVGVGQSEVVVRGMVDCFLVLLLAGAGDELQGIKKGVIELADVLAVNKADGENRGRADVAQRQVSRALHYLSAPEGLWQAPVLTCSALTGEGVAEVWQAVERFVAQARASGAFAARRRAQALAWLDALVTDGVREAFAAHPDVQRLRRELELKVAAGLVPAPAAARLLLNATGWTA